MKNDLVLFGRLIKEKVIVNNIEVTKILKEKRLSYNKISIFFLVSKIEKSIKKF